MARTKIKELKAGWRKNSVRQTVIKIKRFLSIKKDKRKGKRRINQVQWYYQIPPSAKTSARNVIQPQS